MDTSGGTEPATTEPVPVADMTSGPISPSDHNDMPKRALRDALSPRSTRAKSVGITLSPLAVQMTSIKPSSPATTARPLSHSDSKSAPKLQATGEKPPAYKDKKHTDMSRSFFKVHGKAESNQGNLDRSQSEGTKSLKNDLVAQQDDVTKLKDAELVARKVSGFSVESADTQTPCSSQVDSRRTSNNLLYDSDGYNSESGSSGEEDNGDDTPTLNLQASMSQESARATRTTQKATSVHEMAQNMSGTTEFLAKVSSMDLDMSTRRFQDVELKDRLVRAKMDSHDPGYESEPSAVVLGDLLFIPQDCDIAQTVEETATIW